MIKLPGTKFTVQDLCRTRKIYGEVKPGMVLVKDGAHQRKYLVESVTYVGIDSEFYNTPHHRWAIAIRLLGHFYSDGRYTLPVRPETREIFAISNPDKGDQTPYIHGFTLSEPVGGLVNDIALVLFKAPRPEKYVPQGQSSTVTKTYVAPPPRPPEQILADFALKF